MIPAGAVLLGAALLLNLGLAALWPSLLWSVLATALYLYAVARLFNTRPVAIVLLSPYILVHLSALLSLNAIEAGGYMKEMAYPGGPSFAAASYVPLILIFLTSAVWVFAGRKQPIPQPTASASPPPHLIRAAPALAGLFIVAWLFLNGLSSGFPLLTGTDRFAFRRLHADILTLNLLNLKILVGAVLGVGGAFSKAKASQRFHHALITAYILVSFLYGDKFFIILNSLIFYIIPFLLRHPENTFNAVRRTLPFGVPALAALFGLTLFIYSGYGTRDLSEAAKTLGERVSGQGQLWYMAVINSFDLLHVNGELVYLNVKSLSASPASEFVFNHRLAAFYFVERYSPQDLYNASVHQSGWVTPTMVYEAYSLVVFGYLGAALVMLVTGIFAGLLIALFWRALHSGNVFNVLLPAFLMAQLGYLLSQGTVHILLGVGSLKAYAAMLMLQLLVLAIVHNVSVKARVLASVVSADGQAHPDASSFT